MNARVSSASSLHNVRVLWVPTKKFFGFFSIFYITLFGFVPEVFVGGTLHRSSNGFTRLGNYVCSISRQSHIHLLFLHKVFVLSYRATILTVQHLFCTIKNSAWTNAKYIQLTNVTKLHLTKHLKLIKSKQTKSIRHVVQKQ